jgi:hypothetical protein
MSFDVAVRVSVFVNVVVAVDLHEKLDVYQASIGFSPDT